MTEFYYNQYDKTLWVNDKVLGIKRRYPRSPQSRMAYDKILHFYDKQEIKQILLKARKEQGQQTSIDDLIEKALTMIKDNKEELKK